MPEFCQTCRFKPALCDSVLVRSSSQNRVGNNPHSLVDPDGHLYNGTAESGGSDSQWMSQRSRTLSSVASYRNEMFNLAGDGSTPPEALYGLRVIANLFSTIGVAPMFGSNILHDEDQPGYTNEMMLSYGLWVRRFNSELTMGANLRLRPRPRDVSI
jgi:hypothetical protein